MDAETTAPGITVASLDGAAPIDGATSGVVVGDPDLGRWEAVVARDRTADTGWVYGVRTTGIYCRPGCPSRRPRRENVAFYADAAHAEAAGLRACHRCRPEVSSAPDPATDLVTATAAVIDRSLGAPTLDELAAAVGVSPHHLQRVFTDRTGVSPRAYAERRRAERVAHRLEEGAPVSNAAYDAGFGSVGRLSAAAPTRLGMTPSRYRAGGDGEVIRVALGESSLGSVLVAATDRGVCAIELGDDPDLLLRSFLARFHAAEVLAGDPSFDALVARVVATVERPGSDPGLPLDVRGTAFQERVWQALRALPAGTTTTYTALAEAIGSPRSVRAVAGACAANQLAVAIPCHRVVRVDGSLSGYRWGVERKRALIDREAAQADIADHSGQEHAVPPG